MDKKHKLQPQERNPKRTKTEGAAPAILKSPLLKGKVLKVIPPKAPKSDSELAEEDYVMIDREQAENDNSMQTVSDSGLTKNDDHEPETTDPAEIEKPLEHIESTTVPRIEIENVSHISTKSENVNNNAGDKITSKTLDNTSPKSIPLTPTKIDPKEKVVATPIKIEDKTPKDGSKDAGKDIDQAKATEDAIFNSLKKMEFKSEKSTIVQVIQKAKLEKKRVVITDRRLLDYTESKYLGHIVYTGATSRAHHSNRGADLELFLIPEFNSTHHFATIQVRIPAEFLSYRGNIAVRKSALWGTDIYTDDSDVVASTFFLISDYSFWTLSTSRCPRLWIS